MPFDPSIFEAEVALKLIATEKLPLRAQDALEAGFDGPHTLRLAILEGESFSEIDQALALMLHELGLAHLSPAVAAMRLAKDRAQQLLKNEEDPVPSLPYFLCLLRAGDYPDDLYELAYLDDDWVVFDPSAEEQRTCTIEALQNLLDPELRQQRYAARQTEWQREREAAQQDWPYIFNSPTGRRILRERYKERLRDTRLLFVIEAVAWALLGWVFSSWKLLLLGYIVTVPLFLLLAYWTIYRGLKQERQEKLRRLGVPDDKI